VQILRAWGRRLCDWCAANFAQDVRSRCGELDFTQFTHDLFELVRIVCVQRLVWKDFRVLQARFRTIEKHLVPSEHRLEPCEKFCAACDRASSAGKVLHGKPSLQRARLPRQHRLTEQPEHTDVERS